MTNIDFIFQGMTFYWYSNKKQQEQQKRSAIVVKIFLVGMKSGTFHYQTSILRSISLHTQKNQVKTGTYDVRAFFIHVFNFFLDWHARTKIRITNTHYLCWNSLGVYLFFSFYVFIFIIILFDYILFWVWMLDFFIQVYLYQYSFNILYIWKTVYSNWLWNKLNQRSKTFILYKRSFHLQFE